MIQSCLGTVRGARGQDPVWYPSMPLLPHYYKKCFFLTIYIPMYSMSLFNTYVYYPPGLLRHETSELLLAVEFVEVVRGKLLTTDTKSFLLVSLSLSVLLRMSGIFLCLSPLNVE
jgi:hypothetical protein